MVVDRSALHAPRAAALALAGCRIGSGVVCAGPACAAADGGAGDAMDGAAGSPYAAAVLADAPLLYLRLDDAAGPTARSLVGGLAGTYRGDFVFGTSGATSDGNGAVTFDGRTTFITLGDVLPFVGTAPYTLEAWIRPTSIGDTRFVLDRRSADNREGYTIYFGDTYLLHAREAANREFGYVNAGPPPLGVWIHVVASYDPAIGTRLYVDGVEVARNGGNGQDPIGGVGGVLAIGDSAGEQFNKFEGEIDEVAIYGAALPAERIAAHHAAAQ